MKAPFCNYEITSKLKELGFDERCIATYMKPAACGNPFKYNLDYSTKVQLDYGLTSKNSDYINDWVSAPLWQQAMSFLFKNLDFYYPYLRIEIFADGSGNWIQPLDDGNDALELEFDNIEEAIVKAIEKLKLCQIKK